MKKNVLAWGMAALMAASMLSACGSGDSTTTAGATEAGTTAAAEAGTTAAETAAASTDAETTAAAGDKKTFTVGFDAEFPPYGYKDPATGEYTGFDLELAQAVCDLEGWELVKTPISWDAKDMELSSGTIDCIWNGFTMTGLEDAYTWSDPYIDNSQVIVVLADSEVQAQKDLAGKVVGVQKDSSALKALQNPEKAKELADSFDSMQQYADYNTAFMDLEAGAIDAIAVDIGVAKNHMAADEGKFRYLDEILAKEEYAVGFLKGNTELRDTVQKDLDALKADGTIQKLAEKYDVADMLKD
ncbi:amino acid ABC transporter substrate-binding protein [Cuneatibacter sp. NSJ-177]|uniref:amino acid ABC transporter substrate-binding protein n=1 Tax=Cuneatibacter sp. NSJ-177 TaxID=2931401 RepID=UPI001FD275CC|nr:amino acid ABC transporter substrate-binding protein [Cuneatibacter sp. NSJ-177]MCJ7834092.1 amino acid ABC transporter substrate-binding protein [Cuneatibacter sp. NSJ-177]